MPTATRATPTPTSRRNTRIDPETRIVDFDFEVERGRPVYFERIEISGNTKTRDKVIRREMEIYERRALQRDRLERLEAPHHRARLLRARRRLDRAGPRAEHA